MTPAARAIAGCAVLLAMANARPVGLSAQLINLSVTPQVISFPAAHPDLEPVVTSIPVQIVYRVRQNVKQAWTMTLLAGGDLVSGTASVDIANVGWVAAPSPPFQNGTLTKTVAQMLASGFGNENPVQTGTITFRLNNLWTHSAGIYTQTVFFTLTAP
jgi:hypothetical protein